MNTEKECQNLTDQAEGNELSEDELENIVGGINIPYRSIAAGGSAIIFTGLAGFVLYKSIKH